MKKQDFKRNFVSAADRAVIVLEVAKAIRVAKENPSDMEKIKIAPFFEFARGIYPVRRIFTSENPTYGGHAPSVDFAIDILERIEADLRRQNIKIEVCLPALEHFKKVLKDFLKIAESKPEGEFIDIYDITRIAYAYDDFETVFLAEINSLHTYVIPQKWIYDTDALLFAGERLLPEDVLQVYSMDLQGELKAFGRCFATNTFTAAGFHLYRALEIILRDYYKEFVGALPKKESRSWGRYINDIEKHGASTDTIKKWRALKDEQRNEIMHPDMSFTEEDIYDIISDFHKLVKGTTVDIMKKKDPNSPLTKMFV